MDERGCKNEVCVCLLSCAYTNKVVKIAIKIVELYDFTIQILINDFNCY